MHVMAEIFLPVIKKADLISAFFFYIERFPYNIDNYSQYCSILLLNPTILEIAIIPDAPSILAR
jgi:hypothetical protein